MEYIFLDFIKAGAQIIVALAIFNVWILRFNKPTQWRSGTAKNLQEEFSIYGLPSFVLYLVGGLKLCSAFFLIIGFWIPSLIMPTGLLIAFLMAGAVAMHLKAGDPFLRALPAFAMLILSLIAALM